MAKKNRNPATGDGSSDGDVRENDGSRREILKMIVTAGIGVCAVGTPLCAGARMVLAPVFQEGRAGKFYPLTTVDSLMETPQKFYIVDEKRDAWMNTPEQTLGSLFLRKVGDRIIALHSLCPHAGCMVQVGTKKNPQTGTEEEMFHCPCHAAHFDLDGTRLDEVSPRDLDSLETKIEDGTVFVKFENFTFGITEKRGS